MKDLVTIVIPCKNEKNVILKTLDLLNYQAGIHNVKVIICDASNDGITKSDLIARLESKNRRDTFDLYITEGGLPAIARNNGFKIVKTPYVLFMDADVFLLDPKTIKRSLLLAIKKDLDLTTVKFRSDNGKYNYVFKTFDVIQRLIKPFSPFCIGGFMMFNKKTFDNLGRFDELATVAEDYLLSKKVSSNKFKKTNKTIFTLPRRFEKKGVLYMVVLMIQSFFNRNNNKFFSNHKTYWT